MSGQNDCVAPGIEDVDNLAYKEYFTTWLLAIKKEWSLMDVVKYVKSRHFLNKVA